MTEEVKKFYRSRTDRVLFGVCGGLGKYFGVDPILFRLFFILLFLLNGVGILLYFIMVIITPEEPGRSSREKDLEGEFNELASKIENKAQEVSEEIKKSDMGGNGAHDSSSSRSLLGAIIIIFGMFFLAKEFFPAIWIDSNMIWSLLIIGIGLYIIFKR